MATSGYKDATVTSHDTLRLIWTRTDYSIPNNTSTVKWELLLITDSVGRISTSNARAWAVTVNGTAYSGTSIANVGNSSTLTLASGSTTIGHNSDGSKTFSYSFSYNFSGITFSGTALGTVSGSSTGTLDTIPRVSSISVPVFTMGTAGTITIRREASSFSDTLTWSFGSASGTIATKTTATSVSWTPDTATLAAEIPNAVSGMGTITCITYLGSTEVGRSSVTFTAKIRDSVVPSISKVTTSEATSGLASQFGVYVQSKSTLKVAITAAGIYGSTIKSYSVSFDGKTYSGNNCTTSAPSKSGSLTLTATVTDSRGRKYSKDITVSVTAYSNPAITALSAHRCDANGNTQDDGDYVSITYAYSISAVGNKNTKSAVIQYKRSTASDWTNLLSNTAYSASTTVVPTTALSADYQWDIRLTVTDYFGASDMTVLLPSAEVIMDLLASGDGASFGKTSEEPDLLDVAWGMRIAGELSIKDCLVADFVIGQGVNGIWTYRKWYSGVMELWGKNNFGEVSISTAYGSDYISDLLSQEIPSGLLAETPKMVSKSILNTSSRVDLLVGEAPNATSAGKFYVKSYNSKTINNLIVGFHVIGVWK